MTERWSGFLVSLEKDIREDDGEAVLNALRCIRGVIKVEPVAGGYNEAIAEERVRRELGQKLWNVLYPDSKK
jgi:hypothetical protein